MSNYLANLNERQQVTFNVSASALLYPALPGASWRLQVRPYAGAPTILLDSNAGSWVYTPGAVTTVTFRWPQSACVGIPSGSAAFDFGFVLPNADFELAGAGAVTFFPGVTQAGVSGSPSAPAGADDTWVPQGAVTAATLSQLSAVAAAASSAAALNISILNALIYG